MNQKDRCKGRKGSLGKKTDALDPDEHFDVIALMLEPPASCCNSNASNLYNNDVIIYNKK
jgi:hypothetical protein